MSERIRISAAAVILAKAPPGTYWRGGTLHAKIKVRGKQYRQTLSTSDPEIAITRVSSLRAKLMGEKILPPIGDGIKQYIYFIRSGRNIKIGIARNVAERLRIIQSGNPQKLLLLGCIPGSHATETRIHTEFSHLRQTGEWFRLDAELLGYIRSILNGWAPQ